MAAIQRVTLVQDVTRYYTVDVDPRWSIPDIQRFYLGSPHRLADLEDQGPREEDVSWDVFEVERLDGDPEILDLADEEPDAAPAD